TADLLIGCANIQVFSNIVTVPNPAQTGSSATISFDADKDLLQDNPIVKINMEGKTEEYSAVFTAYDSDIKRYIYDIQIPSGESGKYIITIQGTDNDGCIRTETGEFNVIAQCTGTTVWNNADICVGDDIALPRDTTKTLVDSCTDNTKCEYECNTGYHKEGQICVVNNNPPTITKFTVTPSKVVVGDMITIDISATDDKGILKVAYQKETQPPIDYLCGSTLTCPKTWQITESTPGTKVYTGIAEDIDNIKSTKDAQVQIISCDNCQDPLCWGRKNNIGQTCCGSLTANENEANNYCTVDQKCDITSAQNPPQGTKNTCIDSRTGFNPSCCLTYTQCVDLLSDEQKCPAKSDAECGCTQDDPKCICESEPLPPTESGVCDNEITKKCSSNNDCIDNGICVLGRSKTCPCGNDVKCDCNTQTDCPCPEHNIFVFSTCAGGLPNGADCENNNQCSSNYCGADKKCQPYPI
ncbi:MAG: hypothetical protein AABY14_01145, partial [Nanoarchaeota archaeon]